MKELFELLSFSVVSKMVEGGTVSFSEATVRIRIGEEVIHTAAGGNGPINALDSALRKALEGRYPEVGRFHLVDYKVRATDSGMGTATPVAVTLKTREDSGHFEWTTNGVADSVIDATWQALVDGFVFGLHDLPLLKVAV